MLRMQRATSIARELDAEVHAYINHRERQNGTYLFGRKVYETMAVWERPEVIAQMPAATRDLGPSLNTEQMWFNQAAGAPLPDWEKSWFQSQSFRVAVSRALKRADLARIAYAGHATPAYSFISP